MYIVIYLDSKGNFTGPARLMEKETYERICRHIRTKVPPPIHIVNEAKLSEYPAELFTAKDVKKYIESLKKPCASDKAVCKKAKK